MINHQLGRRNITDQQRSYLRGVQYEREKERHGGDRKSVVAKESKGQSDLLIDTAEKLATEHKVGEKTIRRNATYAHAVNAIVDAVGDDAKTDLLSADSKVSKQDAVKLGEIASVSPETGIAPGKLWHGFPTQVGDDCQWLVPEAS